MKKKHDDSQNKNTEISSKENQESQEQISSDISKVLEKVDKESSHRNLKGIAALVITLLAISFSIFHLFTGFFGTFDAHIQRAIHLAFVLCLVFLLYPSSEKSKKFSIAYVDILLAVVAVSAMIYIVVEYKNLVMRAGITTSTDLMLGIIGVLLTMEAARRIIGWPMVIIAVLFILYAFFGEIMPNSIAHKNISIPQLVAHLFFSTEGIFGIPLGVSSTFLFLFLLFAAFLEKTHVGKMFINLGNTVAGFASGGPAKVAVITSALEGMVEGSSVSNVVGSGSLTIPMMKKLGYKPEFAGAVEAAASTGGQIMPPIMGAAAFLMAEFLGMRYVEVALAAVIPALLYFIGIFAGVHFEAKKLGLKGLAKDQIPAFKDIMIKEGHLLIPIVGIILLLTLSGWSLMRIALLSSGLCIFASLFRKWSRITIKDFFEALEKGARNALGVATACATAGIIVGVVTKTGIGLKLGSALIDMAQGNRLITMFFTMLTSLILGMGVPTTANYIITSTICAGALINIGVRNIAAHMFVFYFGIVADLTPPVALAAYAGAAIAKGNPFKTGVIASRLAIGAFIIPYIFVYSPQMLFINATFLSLTQIIITSVIGMISISAALCGFYLVKTRWWQVILLICAGLMLIDPGLLTDIIGIGIFLFITALQITEKKKLDLGLKYK